MTVYDRKSELGANLRASLASFTGRPVGLGRAPFKSGETRSFPYGVIHSISGGGFGGSFDFPDEDIQLTYEVMSVGNKSAARADWMGDRVRRFFLERDSNGAFVNPIDPGPGWSVVYRDSTTPGGITDEENQIFNLAEIYRLYLTKSG